jgi:RNA 3'-terminal phosphate cyclase (ATP)
LKRVDHLRLSPCTQTKYAPSPGRGTVLFLAGRFEGGAGGFTSLGRRGKKAEAVADDACNEFLAFLDSNGVVDVHLADQLVLYMALARGTSTLITERISDHLLTNMWVIEQFAPVKFNIDRKAERITVNGMGFH